MDNNLSITFVENKTKSILLATEFKKKNLTLDIKYGDKQTKNHSKVKDFVYYRKKCLEKLLHLK